MLIRTGSLEELKRLWKNDTPTKEYFIEGIKRGNIEFWTIENEIDSSLIGELYIFWDSEDKDEANGIDRAYLCAFRIEKNLRGLGLGKKLMEKVLQRIKEKEIKEVTIAADNDDAERLTAMYKSWGFNELVKLQNYDYHYIDNHNNPIYYEIPFGLYLNRLG
ncbi:MAG: GNAT family N-acetyltransferase [Clostridium sp.]